MLKQSKEEYCQKCRQFTVCGKCECGDLVIEEGLKRFAHAMKDGQKHPPINGHESIEDAPLLD